MGKSASKEHKSTAGKPSSPAGVSVETSTDLKSWNCERPWIGGVSDQDLGPTFDERVKGRPKKGSGDIEIPILHQKKNVEAARAFNKTQEALREKELSEIYHEEASTLRGETSTWMLQEECDDAFVDRRPPATSQKKKAEEERAEKRTKKKAPFLRRQADYSIIYNGDNVEIVNAVSPEAVHGFPNKNE